MDFSVEKVSEASTHTYEAYKAQYENSTVYITVNTDLNHIAVSIIPAE